MTEPEAWLAFVAGARAWAEHLDQWDRIKFPTAHGPVFVSITRVSNKPGRFDEVDEAGNVIERRRSQHERHDA